jgi:hypothetical protein
MFLKHSCNKQEKDTNNQSPRLLTMYEAIRWLRIVVGIVPSKICGCPLQLLAWLGHVFYVYNSRWPRLLTKYATIRWLCIVLGIVQGRMCGSPLHIRNRLSNCYSLSLFGLAPGKLLWPQKHDGQWIWTHFEYLGFYVFDCVSWKYSCSKQEGNSQWPRLLTIYAAIRWLNIFRYCSRKNLWMSVTFINVIGTSVLSFRLRFQK